MATMLKSWLSIRLQGRYRASLLRGVFLIASKAAHFVYSGLDIHALGNGQGLFQALHNAFESAHESPASSG